MAPGGASWVDLCPRPGQGTQFSKVRSYHPAGIAQVCNLDLDLVCILGL